MPERHDPTKLPGQTDPVALGIRRLAFALRVRRFYPPRSPVFARKLEDCHQALSAAIGQVELQLDILPEQIGWSTGGSEYLRLPEADLAASLHRRLVARLYLGPALAIEALRDLIEDLADPAEPDDTKPNRIIAGGIPGVRADVLDFDALFRQDGSDAMARHEAWNLILSGFSRHTGLAAESWNQLTRDPETLARFFDWALSPDSQPAEMRRHSQPDAFGLMCEHMVSVAVDEPEAVVATLTQAAVSLFDRLDPEAWLEILSDPFPLEFGGEADEGEHDLTASIAHALSDEQVRSLIRYALRTRSRATPRLYRFFDRVLRERTDRERFATETLRQVPRAMTEEFAAAWPQFLKVLMGEDIEPFVNADYEVILDQATAPATAEPVWEMSRIGRRFKELDAEFVRQRKARIAFALLGRETDDDDYALLLEALEEAIPVIMESRDFDLLEAIVSTLARHAVDPHRSESQRQAALEALRWLKQPELMRELARMLADGSAQFHALWRIVENLGSTCVPALFEALESRGSPAYRTQLARMLRSLPETPWDLLHRGLESTRLTYVRDLLWILAELNEARCRPLFNLALQHSLPEIRRRALAGLIRVPGADTEGVLIAALSDPALEVRIAALRGFLDFHRAGSRHRLHDYLRLPNWNGINNNVIVAAIKALTQIGDESALRPLDALTRPPLLFRHRREPVWKAARQAVQALRQRLQDTAPERVIALDSEPEPDQQRAAA